MTRARESRLPNFLAEDYLVLLRALVTLAWAAVGAMALLKALLALADEPLPTLGGFATTYNLLLAELTLTTALLSVLAVKRDWFDRIPREAGTRLRALVMLVVGWLAFHHLFALHALGGLAGPLVVYLPLLVLGAFLMLPAEAGWALALVLLAGHAGVYVLEWAHWIESPGALAELFAPASAPGMTVLALGVAAALALGALARRRLDQAGANLHRDNRINPLTGLYEHAFLLQRLDNELERLRRQGGSLACLLLEFEQFADVTRQQGYDEGRRVLRRAAQALIDNTRHEMDTPARYAATTFALLLPGTRAEHAQRVLERIRKSLAEDGTALSLRVGMACVTRPAGLTAAAVTAAAARALQAAHQDNVGLQSIEAVL